MNHHEEREGHEVNFRGRPFLWAFGKAPEENLALIGYSERNSL